MNSIALAGMVDFALIPQMLLSRTGTGSSNTALIWGALR
jgi:hypothetical protein